MRGHVDIVQYFLENDMPPEPADKDTVSRSKKSLFFLDVQIDGDILILPDVPEISGMLNIERTHIANNVMAIYI